METDHDAAEPGHKTQASAEEASEKNGKTMEAKEEEEEEEEEDVPIADMWLRIDLGNAKNCKVLAKLDREEALLMQLWPIISKDVDGCHADIIHVSVALLWYATSGKRALLVQGMSQHAVFPDYVQRVVRQFTQLDPRASETRNVSTSYLGMFSLFFGRMDLQSVRSSLLRLSSHELWNLVDAERLARHLSEQGSALRQQWKTLNSKSIDDSEKEYIHGFWRSVFAHALIGVSLRARKEALKFITNCLMSPMLRRFLALLVEDASLVARLELQVSADDHSTHVLLEKLDQALVCATKRSEEVRRFRTARVRLLQRVLDRHFSESHANLAYLPVSKAQVAIDEEGTLAKSLNANQLAALCDYLGLSTRRVPSLHGCKPEELISPQSKAFLAKVLQVAHRPVKPFGKCTKDKGDAKAWFLLPGGSNVAFEDDLLKLENEGRARATLVREALACRLQHISEEAMIEENLVHMMEEARFALAYDLRRALELLAVREDASSPTKISFGGWARMAMPCSLLTRSSVKCSFVDTPRPIVAEWASLPVSQLSVVLCAVELDPKTKNRCRVTAIYPAQVRSVDLAGGVVSLHWICNDKQPIHSENAPQQQQYVLVRRKWANDVPRRVGLALIKQLMDSSEQKLLPDAFAHFLLGHGKALQRATDDRLRLMHYSGDAFVGDIVEDLVGPNPDKTLIVVPDEVHAVVLVQYLAKETAHPFTRLRRPDISGRIAACLQRRLELLAEVEEIATGLGVAGASHFSCETALHFYRLYVQPELKAYEASEEVPPFPFAFYFGTRDDRKNRNKREVYMIRAMFEELNSYRLLELIWDFNKRMDFVLHDHSRIVVAAVEDMLQYIHTDGPCKRLRMDRIIFLYAGRLLERDAMLMFAGLDRQRLSRMIVAGDRTGEMPRPRSSTTSLFEKLCRLGVRYERPAMPKTLNATLDERFGLADFAPALVPLDKLLDGDGAAGATERNPGFALRAQFIDVKGRERVTAHPGEVQNLEEAEWVVALFHYMLALGYPPKEIVILTPYQAQKLLIIDVLHSRARATNPPLPFPRAILSFEEHVGETVSFVLMSLVRTSTLQDDLMGDPRRSIFAASAARKGLYVVGNAKVFRNHLIFGQLIRAAPDGKLRLRFDNFFKRAAVDPRGRAPSNSITNLDEASVPAAKRQKMVAADGKVEDSADAKVPASEDFVVDGLGHLGSLVALMLWNRPHSLFMPSPKLLPPPPPPATKPKVA
ncbi:Regulator of nonsense transcripts 1 [Hondaea fermentalgiana]|uniref:Regulator of nonsense transcripts 1 n=1 Tax=Hondaea fermentalgiana TaxID=2315210 RepID=A0A2R5G136_9STRA|nr:Regulator of nonsense transcripts 1 [Hondaea fermentalgiana]|eukprot:GBG24736.1 Regulator of nonsense transcripts 1 [Hondaea fermentalgiana]